MAPNGLVPRNREIWVDWMRTAACAMVMIVHSTEPFYLGGDGSQILSQADAWWSAVIDSFVRCCVPLFLVASSYLQFPIKYGTGEFFRRRALRILPPFVLWSIFYALWWGEPVQNFKDLLLNFNYAAGHLWFVYMLIGLYLIMPLLSPWAEKVSKKELGRWLLLWLFTTLLPLIRSVASGGEVVTIEGPSGVPQFARYPLWGEASWNAYGLFYYVSGMAGYLLLGLYFRKFPPQWSRCRTACVALAAFIVGFAITAGDFICRVFRTTDGVFPFNGPVRYAVGWETMWVYDAFGVVLMTVGCLLLFRLIPAHGGRFYSKAVLPVSNASYGMYLMHMVLLAPFSSLYRSVLYDPAAAWTTPVVILCTAVSAYLCSALISVLVQRIPKVGKYIVG